MTTKMDQAQASEAALQAQLTGAAHAEVAQVAAAEQSVPEQKIRILVVDDELFGMNQSHLTDEFKQVLGDVSSPEVEEIWAYAMKLCGRPALEEAPKDAAAFLTSDELVRQVLLHPTFIAEVQEPTKSALQFFHERAAKVATLRNTIEEAFPEQKAEITWLGARPSAPEELFQYDLLILDLVLGSSASAVDELVKYLAALGRDAYPRPVPCVVVMSSHRELVDHQIQFSTKSNISAAGLLILPKGKIEKAEFGAEGMLLSYRQLERQRDVAQQMRVFMRAWTDALEAGKNKAAEALWNLDAAAMQEIHLVAHNDNDPYDEFLNALISREYLWHVESVQAVADAIKALDECFQAQLVRPDPKKPAAIRQRFIAPFVEPKHGRELVSHFTWTGMPLPQSLSKVDLPTATKEFSSLVPFGGLLAPPNLALNTECLVHITQQCDLNQQRDGQSVLFAVAKAKPVKNHSIDVYKEELVARGLTIQGKEWDFVLEKGRQISVPTKTFVRWAKRNGLQVCGRLRHDIAMHFLLATTNNMTRWASQKVDHIMTLDVKLYLHGKKFENGHVVLKDSETGEPLVVSMAKTNSNTFYFRDTTSIRIALWLAQESAKHYDMSGVSTEVVCNKLSIPQKSGACLEKFIDLKVKDVLPENLKELLKAEKAPEGKVELVCVFNSAEL